MTKALLYIIQSLGNLLSRGIIVLDRRYNAFSFEEKNILAFQPYITPAGNITPADLYTMARHRCQKCYSILR